MVTSARAGDGQKEEKDNGDRFHKVMREDKWKREKKVFTDKYNTFFIQLLDESGKHCNVTRRRYLCFRSIY